MRFLTNAYLYFSNLIIFSINQTNGVFENLCNIAIKLFFTLSKIVHVEGGNIQARFCGMAQ